MNVLSLCDGISGGYAASKMAGIEFDKYYSSEINKYANKLSEDNYPEIIRLGDMNNWGDWDIDWSSIGLLLAGFPCQVWSKAGKQQGDNDPRGALVHTVIEIWDHIKLHNPNVQVLFENVRMKKEFQEYIDNLFGIKSKLVNSALVSAQNRERLYWTSWNFEQPKDERIYLKDILEDEVASKYRIGEGWLDWWLKNGEFQLKKKYSSLNSDKAITMTARQYASWNGNFVTCVAQRGRNIVDGVRKDYYGAPTEQRLEPRDDGKTNCLTTVTKDNYVLISKPERIGYIGKGGQGERVYSAYGKNICLSALGGGRGAKTGLVLDSDLLIRRLTPRECARLQTYPDTFKITVSDSQAYKCFGNGWNLKTIAHILIEWKKHNAK